jgi:hypothetical protein
MKINHLVGYLAITASVLCQGAWANTLDIEYASFYSHLRKIDNADMAALQFSFGFKKVAENRLCQITGGRLITQKVTMDIAVNEEQRFTLPTEKALKLANAVVSLELQEAANQCDLSVQLETKPIFLRQHYSAADLQNLSEQYAEFFDSMGGFLDFLMPSSKGLVLHFAQAPILDTQEAGLTVKGNDLTISQAWIASNKNPLNFMIEPLRITALVVK